MPANYKNNRLSLEDYATHIKTEIKKSFGKNTPKKIIAEPGRF